MKKITGILFLLLLAVPTMMFGAELTKNLSVGSRDTQVADLQNFLKSQGLFTASVTGYFGSVTKKAVINFQIAQGLQADGKVGKLTRARVNGFQASILKATPKETPQEVTPVSTTPTNSFPNANTSIAPVAGQTGTARFEPVVNLQPDSNDGLYLLGTLKVKTNDESVRITNVASSILSSNILTADVELMVYANGTFVTTTDGNIGSALQGIEVNPVNGEFSVAVKFNTLVTDKIGEFKLRIDSVETQGLKTGKITTLPVGVTSSTIVVINPTAGD